MFNFNWDQWTQLIYLVILLTFLVSTYFLHGRGSPSKVMKQLTIWLVVIFAITVLYNFRGSIIPAFLPYKATVTDDTIEIQKSADNHFYIMLKVNNKNVLFLVDTGATSTTLSLKDAKRVGIDINNLKFNRPYSTANGTIYGASVKLDKVEVGNALFNDVWVSVNKEEMNTSLLGMSFLNKLKGYEINRDKLILHY